MRASSPPCRLQLNSSKVTGTVLQANTSLNNIGEANTTRKGLETTISPKEGGNLATYKFQYLLAVIKPPFAYLSALERGVSRVSRGLL